MRNPVVDEWIARSVLIAQGVPSRKCRDLLTLSGRLRDPIPGWQPDPETLNTLTQAALAYLDSGEGHPEPSEDVTWAIAEAGRVIVCAIGSTAWNLTPRKHLLGRWPDAAIAPHREKPSGWRDLL